MSSRHYLSPQIPQPNSQMPTNGYTTGSQNSQQIYPQPPGLNPQCSITSPWKNSKIMNPDPSPECDSRPLYFRTTMGLFPGTKKTYLQGKLPFGLIVTPGGARDVPLIDLSQSDVPRCVTCRSYLSRFEKLSRNGKSANCPFCGQLNSPKQINGAPILRDRQELSAYVYDIHAPPDYVGNAKAEPGFGFIFDMTAAAIESGFTTQMITSVKSTLPSLDKTVNILFITMDEVAHVFDIRNDKEYIMGDPEDGALPYGIPQPIGEVLDKALTFLDNLITKPGTACGCCLPDAVCAAKAAFGEKGGIILANSYGPPTSGFYGLKPRKPKEDGSRHTEAELLNLPKDGSGQYFLDIATALTENRLSLHLFTSPLHPGDQMDLIQFSSLSALTGGQLHYYPKLDASTLAEMHTDIFHSLTQEYFWNCSIKLRTSRATAVSAIYTNSIVMSDAVTVPILPSSSSIGFDIVMRTDVNRILKDGVLFQLAMMWTTVRKENMIRIFTFRVPITTKLDAMIKSVDEGAMSAFLAKMSPNSVFRIGPKKFQGYMREVVASAKSGSLQSLPYFAHALISSSVAGPGTPPDERFAASAKVKGADIVETLLTLYPRMFDLRTRELMDLTRRSFATNAVLVHRPDRISIWIAPNSPIEDINDIFGVSSIEEIPTILPETRGVLNMAAHVLIEDCYNLSGRYLPVEIISPGSERESELFGKVFVEDSKVSGQDFIEFLRTSGYM